MKTLLRKTASVLSLLLLLAGCNEEETPPAPVPQTGFIESILAKSYWKEEIHFLYQRKGTDNAKIYADSRDIIEAYKGSSGFTFEDQVLMDAVYVDKDRSVWRYVQQDGEYTGYYKNLYDIEYDENALTLRIRTPYDSLRYMGAVTQSELEIVSLSNEQVVFDGPIKTFIRQNWELDDPDKYPYLYVGIRVCWTKTDPNCFTWADQLD